MTGALIRRVAIGAVALGLILISQNAFAQTGSVKGKVVDAQGNAVEAAEVAITSLDKGGKPLVVKTKKDGSYMQVGLSPGQYKVEVSKGDLSAAETVRIGLDVVTHDVKLVKGGGAGAPNPKMVAAQKAFDEAVQLSNADDASKYDDAIAKFEEAANVMTPVKCGECYANIGTVQLKQAVKLKDADAQGKKLDEAEASFKKALELKPEMADAYNGLANLYNAEKKFDQAAEASKKAMELSGAGAAGGAPGASGSGASAYYNQGVILWNASKFPEAKTQFEQAVKLDPNNADAQYMLAMAFVNGGDTTGAKPHFEAYLKLAPTGDKADMVKSILAQIK
jgi:tetratricopeptide (TPR) repeat protein